MDEGNYKIRLEFTPGVEDPSKVLRSMAGLIEAFERIDNLLVKSLSGTIHSDYRLEMVSEGSILIWIRNQLESIDDEDLKDLNWKALIGQYLVKSKYFLIRYLNKKIEVKDRGDLEELQAGLLLISSETNIYELQAVHRISLTPLLYNLKDIEDSMRALDPADKIELITDFDKEEINRSFHIPSTDLEEMLTEKSETNTLDTMLLVKKPDYLGRSQWEVIFKGHAVYAKIVDTLWLARFQKRGVDVRPGDSLDCRLEVKVNFGKDGEVVGKHYRIVHVSKVIPGSSQDQQEIENI